MVRAETQPARTGAAGPASAAVCEGCGARMHEHQRLHENGRTYVWLICSGPNCIGQMLLETPAAAQPAPS